MSHFDIVQDRRPSGCNKWNRYGEDVLPLWVADMDFEVPEPISAALARRLDHAVLGYGMRQGPLKESIAAWLALHYGWQVPVEAIIPVTGVVPGFNLAVRATCSPGAGVVLQTPLYPPMLRVPDHWGLRKIDAPLDDADEVDMDRLRLAFRDAGHGSNDGAFVLCNPHNPTGRVFGLAEIALMAEAALAENVTIISDEIHCDLLFDGRRHLPIGSLSPEVAARTITLMSAGKTFNIAGLAVGWAVITDEVLRTRFQRAIAGVADHPNILGLIATEAALTECEPWRRELVAYLQGNRDWLVRAVAERLPGVRTRAPEGTYLAWLDCRGSVAAEDPYRFFLDRARVALNPGPDFGAPGHGFVRLNFGCARATLEAAVGRMEAALTA